MSLEAVLARGEDAYHVWLKAVRSPGVFEHTFWEEYRRARSEWLAAPPR